MFKIEKSANPQIAKLANLISDIGTAMLTTVSETGQLHSRPMMCLKMDADGALWFLTASESDKVREVLATQRVNLSYALPAKAKYVSVTGRAVVEKNQFKVKDLWNPIYKAWFPKGERDEDIRLLKVMPETAEYWDAPSGKMIQFLSVMKSVITGEDYKPKPDENARIDLRAG